MPTQKPSFSSLVQTSSSLVQNQLTLNKPLSLKHQLFLNEYLANGLNPALAYIKVYKCSKASALTHGSALVNTSPIQEELQKQFKTVIDAKKLDGDWLINGMIKDIEDPKTKPADKIRAREILMKHLGMLKDRQVLEKIGFNDEKEEDLDKEFRETLTRYGLESKSNLT